MKLAITEVLQGYETLDVLYEGQQILVYRALRQSDQLPVVIKTSAKHLLWGCSEHLAFRNQFTIGRYLDHPGIVRMLSLETVDHTYALVMEDVKGISLAEFFQSSVSLMDGLQIAIQLADILHYLSQKRIIHKDIKPSNILINPQTLNVKLIDFGIASPLPKETQGIQHPSALEGSLAYMAPEQTGRTNRGIDFRSDYYGLGVTLYEGFAGQLPFQAEEPMAWLHCHIAQVPPSLTVFGLPVAVADIVTKLLEKNPENRYQSALGLKHDLECCLVQLTEQGEMVPFALGVKDVCDRFLIPEKLYGREPEVQTLLDTFDRVCQGSSELMLVTGCSGIGKTAVIKEVHKPITLHKSYFTQGKFDQFNRNIPFSAFIQAFRGLAHQLLSESDQTLAAWQTKISEAVGCNGQIVLDVIPELAGVIGDQPPAPKLSGTAAQNRFRLVFSQLVQVFTTPEHPLVIFLDDLQWIDRASLNLVKTLLVQAQTGSTPGHLLLIGAYRDNEVHADHPLQETLHELAQQHTPMQTLRLEPLQQADIHLLVMDTLRCTGASSSRLSELAYQKAQGNPFFTTQFLSGLHEDGYITFDPTQGHWQCDLIKVQQLALTDNVVDFMVERLQTLPAATQNVLTFAACIGNSFDIETLAMVCGVKQQQVATDLDPSLQAKLVLPQSQVYQLMPKDLPIGRVSSSAQTADAIPEQTDLASINVGYRFVHDRVQQAAYQLIPADQIQQVHLYIGRQWLASIPPEEQTDCLFDIIGQLNQGRQLLAEDAERQTLIQLNLKAAKRAIAMTIAYDLADIYLQICRELLPADSWQTCYELTLNIYTLSAEVAYLQGKWDAMDALALIIAQQVQDTLDTVAVCALQVEARTINGQFSEAIALGLRCLSKLGIEFPEQPDNQDFQAYLQDTQALLAGRSATEILNLPHNSSPHPRASLQLLFKVGEAAYNAQPELFVLSSQKMVQISIVHGNMPESASSYIGYGMILCNVLGDIDNGYSFGQIAQQLMEQFQTFNHTTDVLLLHHAFISHWQQPLPTTLAPLQRAYTVGVERGDLSSSGYAAHFYCSHAYFVGQDLTNLQVEIQHYGQAIAAINQNVALDYNNILYQAVLNLLKRSDHPTQWVGPAFDETIDLVPLAENQHKFGLLCLYTHQLFLFYLFQDYGQALNAYDQASKVAKSGLGTVYTSHLIWVGALTSLALWREQSSSRQSQDSELEQIVALGKEKLHLWATHNPHTYRHKYALLCAESHRLEGDRLAALEAYEEAIAGAQAGGYLQDEALANELAARFYLDWEKEKIGVTYLKDAYTCYAEWGANAKIHDLEQRYPHYLKSTWQRGVPLINPLETLATVASSQRSKYSKTLMSAGVINQAFDFAAILKAAQALTQTIKLDEFLQTVSQIILQNSGADYLMVVLPKHNAQWQVSVIATPAAIHLSTDALDNHADAPVKLIQYVKNTRELVKTDTLTLDLPLEDCFLKPPPQSFLCAPLIAQEELLGILYLHSSTTQDLFTTDRLITLNFLFSQVAIGLGNALIFENELTLKSQVIEASVDGIAIMAENKFIYLNQVHASLFGYEIEELLGQPWEYLYSLEEAQKLKDIALPQVVSSGHWKGEVTALRKDGSTFEQEVSLFKLDGGQLICVCRDISDRKQLEQEQLQLIQALQDSSAEKARLYAASLEQARNLEESRKRLEQIILQTPAAVIEWNPDCEFLTWNPAAEIIFGFKAEETIGQHFRLIVPPDQRAYVDEMATEILSQSGGSHAINENVTRAGKYITCEWFNAPKFDADGQVSGGISIVFDISERNAKEQELILTKFALDNAATGILWVNAEGQLTHVNEAACITLGYGPDELKQLSIWEIASDLEAEDWSDYWASIRNQTYVRFETCHQAKDGSRFPVEITCNYFEYNGIEHQFVQVQDISDRKAAELALRDSQAQLSRLAENIPAMIFRYCTHPDGSNDILYTTNRSQDIFELEPEVIMQDNQRFWSMVHADDVAAVAEKARISAQNLSPYIDEYRISMSDGRVKWLEVSSRPELNDNGDIIWDGVCFDITDRKQLEQRQNRLIQILQSTSDFIGICKPDQGILWQNQPFRKLRPDLKITEEQVPISKLYPEWAFEIIQQEGLPCAMKHGTWSGETALLTSSGEEIPTSQVIIAHKSDKGKVEFLSTILRDINDRKAAELALQNSQAQFRRMTENVPGMIYRYVLHPDQSDEVTYISSQVREIYQLEPEMVLQDAACLWERVHPDDVARLKDVIDNSVNTLQPCKGEHRLLLPQKGPRWIQFIAQPTRLKSGDVIWDGVVIDITDRKHAERALQLSEARATAVFDQATVGVVEANLLSGKLTRFNHYFCDLLGYSSDELQNMSLVDLTHPDDFIECKRLIKALSTGKIRNFAVERRFLHKNGSIVWVLASANRVQLSNDQPHMGVVILQDISDRKAAELALHDAQTQFRRMTENVPGMIYRYVIHADGREGYTYVSSQVRELFEHKRKTALQNPSHLRQRVHPDDLPMLLEKSQASAATLQPFQIEFRLILPKKGLRWVQIMSRPEHLDNGSIVWDGMAIDISDRKMAALSLQQSEEKFRTLVSNLHGAVYRSENDNAWTMNYMSDAIADLSGYPASDFIENSVRTYASIIHPDDTGYVNESVAQAIANRESFVLEYRILHRDGSIRWVYEKGKGIFDQDNQFQHLEGVIFDISDRKQVEAQLQHTNAELMRATRHKSEFFASMSHELRTPLNAVLGFSQLMQRDRSISHEHYEMLNVINRNGEYLLALINDILEMSKIESGKITLNPTPLDLPQFLDDIHDILKFKTNAKNLQLEVLYSPELPRYIQVDAVKLRQILLNLMGNALKFTQQGQIGLHTQVMDRGQDLPPEQMHLQFTVSDTGPGIKPEDLDPIFQPFIQSASGKSSCQGTGLGLPISRQFAKLMGGNIQVTSIVGKGSTFYCDILAEVVAANDQNGDAQCQRYQNVQGLKNLQFTYRLLIVDDNVDNRVLLSKMLSIPGFEVRTAINGPQAIALNDSWHPHLICMDICMPQMDGLEAIRHIRRSSHLPKMIVTTANAFANDQQAAMAVGCDDFIAKPFTEEMIFQRVAKLLEVEFAIAPEPPQRKTYKQTASRIESQDVLVKTGFRAMPVEWQERLEQFVRTLDDHSIRVLLADVPEEYGGMVDAVSLLLKDYRYDILMNILNIEP